MLLAGPRGGRLGGRHAADGRVRSPGRRAAAERRPRRARFLADLLVGVGSLYEGETAIGTAARAGRGRPRRRVRRAELGRLGGDRRPGARRRGRGRRRCCGAPSTLARASGAVDKLTYVLLDLRADGAPRRPAWASRPRRRRASRWPREAGLPNAAEHAPGHARLVRGRSAARRTNAARPPPRRSSWRGPAAAASRTRSPSGASGCSSSAGAAGTRRSATSWPSATRGPGVGHPYFALHVRAGSRRGVRARRAQDRRARRRRAVRGLRPAGRAAWALALAARCRALLSEDPARRSRRGAAPARGERPRRSTARGRSCSSASTWSGRAAAARRASTSEPRSRRSSSSAPRGWAERARAGAAGRAARRRSAATRPCCPGSRPQELQIARLVADGHSNREVAARLFLSPRTIDAQLRGVFAKLGISSRFELAQLGSRARRPPAPAPVAAGARRARGAVPRPADAARRGAAGGAGQRPLGDPDARGRVSARRRTPATPTREGNPVVPARRPAASARSHRSSSTAARPPRSSTTPRSTTTPSWSRRVCAAATHRAGERAPPRRSRRRGSPSCRRRASGIVAAGDAERRRLERNLHDGAQQRLVALAHAAAAPPVPTSAATRRRAEALVTSASDELAAVARRAAGARARDPSGGARTRASRRRSSRSPPRSTVPTAVSCEVDGRACRSRSSSRSTSSRARRWRTSASTPPRRAASMRLLAHRAPASPSRSPTTAWAVRTRRPAPGLRGLADRVEALDGLLLVTSPPGAGTVITAELPIGA